MTTSLHNFPEGYEFFKIDNAIFVLVNLTEKFFGWNSAEFGLPVIKSLFNINLITAVFIEYIERLLDFLFASFGQFSELDGIICMSVTFFAACAPHLYYFLIYNE